MRTPKEINEDILRLTDKKQALLKELAQSKLGVKAGDTITNGTQSITITKIGTRYISGTLTDTNYELRIESLDSWKRRR